VHNLRSVDVDMPKNSLVVFCGLSGSGKSSLAFDTIFAEGQRRYLESLSSYARQFLDRVAKPDVDSIEGLSPAVAIDQKSTGHNPRSTVGTVTEIWDYLRVLFARVGEVHCHLCGTRLTAATPDATADAIVERFDGREVVLLLPLVSAKKGSHAELFSELVAAGFTRVRVDGTICRLEDVKPLDVKRRHDVDLVLDRVKAAPTSRRRVLEAVEASLTRSGGFLTVLDGADAQQFSVSSACPTCRTGGFDPEPRSFSFNSPYGACETCSGLGSHREVSRDLVVTDPSLSLDAGALLPWSESAGWDHFRRLLVQVLAVTGDSMDTPWKDLPKSTRALLLDGAEDLRLRAEFTTRFSSRSYVTSFEGVIPWLERRLAETAGDSTEERFARFFLPVPCRSCRGRRLRPEALAVKVRGKDIAELAAMSVRDLRAWFEDLELSGRDAEIADRLLKEVRARLGFLDEVGLGYLGLDRSALSLSGGESQRIRLASQIGSGLTGVLYVLDEPSIGLHQRDNAALLATLVRLRDLGNSVLVVEHDEDTLRAADWIVEVGPRAGTEGGRIVYSGPAAGLASSGTVTGEYLSGRQRITTPAVRRSPGRGALVVRKASGNNLAIDEVAFPLGTLTVVTGVSGSGKSTLVTDTLAAALSRKLHRTPVLPAKHEKLLGAEAIDKLVMVDQSPIGRTPRSNPATYTGLFDAIRDLFANCEEAKVRGYRPGRFSFNVPTRSGGGRCETCAGEGTLRVEMQFLPDVYVRCDDCSGTRFNAPTREVLYKGKSIADVLAMRVSEAREFFAASPKLKRGLDVLFDVGLGYVALGQPATTLSGGEAQRVKLATELLRRATGKTVYILDEPTTGLHTDDVAKLLSVLDRLVNAGNTVIVVEHNLDVVRVADHVIDLGPDGGPEGGRVVAAGTPEEVAASGSLTGGFLAAALASHAQPVSAASAAVTSPRPRRSGPQAARERRPRAGV
jgi:excinuclease ABC subunit A